PASGRACTGPPPGGDPAVCVTQRLRTASPHLLPRLPEARPGIGPAAERSGRIIACPRVLIQAADEPIFADHAARRTLRFERRVLPPFAVVGEGRFLAEGLRFRFRLEGGRDLRDPGDPYRGGCRG